MLQKDLKLIPIPGPSSYPIVGNLFDIDLEHGLQSVLALGREYGEIYKLTLGGNKQLFVHSHALFDELCDESRFSKIIDGGLDKLRAGVKDGLFTAREGEHNWGVAHRIIMPVFGPLKIRATLPGMKDVAQELTLKWERYGADYRIDIAGDLTRLTLDTIALCAMGYRFNSFYRDGDIHPFVKYMFGFLKEADKSSLMPDTVNSLRFKATSKFQHDIENMREICQIILSSRKKNPVPGDDLLNALLYGRDPKTGEGMTDDSIVNNLITFLIAGHETTSGALSFAFYYLLKNPKALEKTKEEIDRVVGTEDITGEHLSKLPYVEAVLRESLRLQPTAPAMTVGALENTVIGGKYYIKKGEPLICMFQNIQSDKAVYGEDADEFRPERMLEENFHKLPKNAWKPFGNGSRGCIGRAFAWQESLLVIASIFQKFDLSLGDPDYKLEIVESLTIKPGNFYVHAQVRNGRSDAELFANGISRLGTNGKTREHISDSLIDSQMAAGFKPMTILYGSNSGTCEALAQRLAKDAPSYGHFATSVGTLDSAVGKLPKAKDELVVVVTSSYDGLPADNAVKFVDWAKTLGSDALKDMPFAVFACGHHDWSKTFYKVPILIDSLIEKAGGRRIAPMGKANAAVSDMFSDIESWEDGALWAGQKNSNGQAANATNGKAKQITITNPRAQALHQNAFQCVATGVRKLTAPNVASKFHIEVQLPAGITYKPGDHLSVLPINPQPNVRRALAHFHLARDSVLSVSKTRQGGQEHLSAFDIFSSYVELAQPATRRNIRTVVSVTPEGREREMLSELGASLFESQIREKRVSVLDLLERFKTANLSISTFIDMLPPIRVRTYSISSTSNWKPSYVSLTISVVEEPALSEQGIFYGVASNFLADVIPGDALHITIRPGKELFSPPSDASAYPIIMVGSGSGLAPFRGFIQDRAIQKRKGVVLQPALLFFGCRGPQLDDLYRDEFDKMEAEGVDKLIADRKDVIALWNRGAKVYVCGRINMADSVKTAFTKIIHNSRGGNGELDKTIADELFEQVISSRYVSEVFSQT